MTLRRSGYTLVEALVTVVIITALLTLLVPALHSARETARVTVCATNLHSIHIVMFGYAHDHAGAFPRVSTFTTCGTAMFASEVHDHLPSKGDMRPLLNPYIGFDADVFYCPSGGRLLKGEAPYNTGEWIEVDNPDAPYGWNDTRPVRYAFISYGLFASDGYFGPRLTIAAQWVPPQQDIENIRGSRNPSEEVLAQDMTLSDMGFSTPGFLNHPFAQSEYYALNAGGTGFNTTFHDGAVAWTRIEDAQIMGTWSSMRWFR